MTNDLTIGQVLDAAMTLFERLGEQIYRVSYRAKESETSRRAKMKTFIQRHADRTASVAVTFDFVAISSKGYESDEISDAWTPKALFRVSEDSKETRLSMYGVQGIDDVSNVFLDVLSLGAYVWRYSSAHIFEFPIQYSPLAYFSSITFDRNLKGLGAYTPRDSLRLENWRNNQYGGLRSADGFMRDIYPINVVGERHLEFSISGRSLRSWIGETPARGALIPFGEKWIWTVQREYLMGLQAALDKAGFLLSGRPT